MLQRLLTVYMQLHEFDKPVINLHELTNGIVKYYSPEFNREILGKPNPKDWDYYQSLEQIVEFLRPADHYVVARLAEYHIKNRQDSVQHQIPFYEFLNKNYFIISCRRKNLFEHALSQSLNRVHKKLNVFYAEEKINSFLDLYRSGVTLDINTLTETLETYRSYLAWCNNFEIGSYFHYEQCIDNMESYILNLPIFMSQAQRVTWQDRFNIDLETWNRCHFYSSDIGSLALSAPQQLLKLGYVESGEKTTILDLAPQHQQQLIAANQTSFDAANSAINHMVGLGIMVNPVPIKKHTLAEKLYLVRNLQQCVQAYNQWAHEHSDIATPVTLEELQQQAQIEFQCWHTGNDLSTNDLRPALISSSNQ